MEGIRVNGFRRVSKPQAKKLYNDGRVVYLCPCYLRPGGMWKPEVAVAKERVDESVSYFVSNTNEFDKLVDEFMYYNCRGGSGKYPAYYIKEDGRY